ncbi:acetate--CoA ligase [Candidatus Parcubacteria bacterium]|nr:acetate--CoA ligase [Candidatus Parcubacteria bacterium]
MIKKNSLYYPTDEFKSKANVSDPKIYEIAKKDPISFWENLAKELFWYKPWQKAFEHNPPYFKWFLGGKINITANIFEKNKLGWEKIRKKTAIIWEPEPIEEKPRILTYEELFEKVCKFANALKRLGVKKGDVVGIYLPMIPEGIISMLACARIGAVHSVVFSAFSPTALKIRLQITEAKVLITADGYWRRGKIINLKESADEAIKDTKVERVIVVKRLGNEIPWQKERDFWFEELIAKENKECRAEEMDSEDLFFVLFTSGTTGIPKGCMHTCGGYTVQAYWTGKFIFDFHEDSILWSTSDFGWITGHSYTVYSPLLNGITTLIYEGVPDFPTPDRWAQIIEKHKVKIFYTAPTAIRMFIKYGEDKIKDYKFETLRLLGSVGEPIDEETWLWYFKNVGKEKCPIVDTWWQTETGGILITSLPGIGPFKPAFAGLPFPGIQVDILDDKGNPCKVGEKGNLVILPPFSPGMLRGTFKDPEKYKKTYWSQYGESIYFTSDGAMKDENGLIRVLGRVDDVIKVAGHRISTGEIESAVNSHPEISESAVVGVPDEIKGEVPVVFAVSKSQKPAGMLRDEIIMQIRKQIGPIALPKEVYLVEDLPKTRSGKIMRRILKRLLTEEELGDLSTLANPEVVEKIKNLIKK